MRKYPSCTDRYLAIVYLDEYGVPTGLPTSYYADIPGDSLYVKSLFQSNPGFQLLGDFEDRSGAFASQKPIDLGEAHREK
jgi:hypothetical protein